MSIALYNAILGALAIGILEGSEISMIAAAAASRYRWKTAWRMVFASLATIVPILIALYFFFEVIPAYWAGIAAAVIIFLLGAHFFLEGMEHRGQSGKDEEEEEKKKMGASLVGVYAAMVMEEIEAGSITMSAAFAVGKSYIPLIAAMLIGLAIPLFAMKRLQPYLERMPEWAVQLAVGLVMMVAALLIVVYRI